MRRPSAILSAILVLSLVPRLATLRKVIVPPGRVVYHLEGDEVIYKALIREVKKDFFHYSLQGTPEMQQGTPDLTHRLDPEFYNHRLFRHPPAFVYTALLLSFIPLPLIPVGMNLITIALVFLIGRRLYDEESGLWAAFLAAVCPVTWFVSQKIWLDNMLILTATASFAVHLWAAERKTAAAYAVSGACFSLAFLSKVTGGLMIFPLLAITWLRDSEGLSVKKAAAFLSPVAVFCGGWELAMRLANGAWLPDLPNLAMAKENSFIALTRAQSWTYYLTSLVTFSPVYVFAMVPASRTKAQDGPLWAWFLAFLVGLTIYGFGGGYVIRFVAPGYPALALLAAKPLPRLRPAWRIAAFALIGYGLINAVIYAVLTTPFQADFGPSAAGLAWQCVQGALLPR
jgi:4-amino-4-deoxy-L-arabinose transferase-like glycosyltransferase